MSARKYLHCSEAGFAGERGVRGAGIRKILVFKVNQLGDNVVFLPVIEQLCRDFGRENVHVFTSPVASGLLRPLLPNDNVSAYPTRQFNDAWRGGWDFVRLLTRVRQVRPDAVILAEDQGNVAHLLAAWSGASVRIGVRRSFVKVRFGLTHVVPDEPDLPQAMQGWRLLEALYAEVQKPNPPARPPQPEIGTGNAVEAKWDFLFHGGGSLPYKRWPLERFGALADRLAEDHSVGWIDDELSRAMALPERVRRVQTPDLGSLIPMLGSARVFVGNNSGPMNLCSALGVPGVIFCGPSRFSWDPFWNPDRFLLLRAPGLPCLPCDRPDGPVKECMNSAHPMACMDYWTVDRAEESCRSWLQRWGDLPNRREIDRSVSP